MSPTLTHWQCGETCIDSAWEEAYTRFETPAEERRKFAQRLGELGADDWPRDGFVVELFCGRGNGLRALADLGFNHLGGVDLSTTLLRAYDGPGDLFVGDCRELQFPPASVDVILVQGGLHHLPRLCDDLDAVLNSIHRSLKHDGTFALVEPWRTPFLDLAHAACRSRILRKCWSKLDALATMIEHEHPVYDNWLAASKTIRPLVLHYFSPQHDAVHWGKWLFVGTKRETPGA